MRPSVLFIGEEYIKKHTTVDTNVDSKLVRVCIESVQEEKILPVLGTALYKRLQAAIADKDLTEEEQTLLNDYIAVSMKWFVVEELILTAGTKITNRGAVNQTGENSEQVGDIVVAAARYQDKGEFQRDRMVKFLRQHASEQLYREYLYPGDGLDDMRPTTKAYTCPIVLDDPAPPKTNGYDYE